MKQANILDAGTLRDTNSMAEINFPSTISSEFSKKLLPKPSFSSYFALICNCLRASNHPFLKSEECSLLSSMTSEHQGKNTLVLDLDETLVHSSFTKIRCDITLEITVNSNPASVYVLKRPGVDKFLQNCAKYFEVVIFTASLRSYAEPLIDALDFNKVITHRLYRDSCTLRNNLYVKDLSRLGRDLNHVIIVDNSPNSYLMQPNNAVPIVTWINNPDDKELINVWKVLETLVEVNCVPEIIESIRKKKVGIDSDTVLNEISLREGHRGESDNMNGLRKGGFPRAGFNSPIASNSEKFEFEE